MTNSAATPTSTRRRQLLTAGALALTAAGIVIAVLQPPWLTEPLRNAVEGAGPAAPVLFVLIYVLASPLHLTGVCTALSVVVWPLPLAVALSYLGGMLGCVLTAAGLACAGTRRARQRDGWPAGLDRLADRVGRHPLLVGITVRFILQSGLAVEAFFLLTGYSRQRYLIATTTGLGLNLAQSVLGILALTALVRVSPLLGLLLVAVPIASILLVMAIRRHRTTRGSSVTLRRSP
jgi:hypothetical protein